jgi:hypothetical protein
MSNWKPRDSKQVYLGSALKITGLLLTLIIPGCFGPPAMHYDIGAYNRDAETAEAEMLLFNIGQLSNELPPHFMMLQEVDQTRTFSAGGSFQWTHLTDSFFHLFGTTPATSVTTSGSNTYQAGPFTTSVAESPTIKFLPIQGADFFQRVESSQTDKFAFFLEEQRWYSTYDEREWLTKLFAESLQLDRGDNIHCPAGLYLNKWPEVNQTPRQAFYFDRFSECVSYITHRNDLRYGQINANHRISTYTGDGPTATDVLAAAQANYRWTSAAGDNTPKTTGGNPYMLTAPVNIPAWLSVPLNVEQVNANEIGDDLWPVANDYFYVELRNDKGTESVCHPSRGVGAGGLPAESKGVICGYFKIANLVEIMKRLGEMACTDTESNQQKNDACVFGIGGGLAPRWADSSASFVYRSRLGINVTKTVWVPAHDPRKDARRAERDRYMFLMLYKVYQTSLVDTSKLVTGSTPITISK